nr:hypothetical protein BHI3_13690 [Bacteriovorax sp. HI3]
MNGISSTLEQEIKKTKEEKHKEKFKLLLTIVLTNIMVALLCWQTKEEVQIKKGNKTLHLNYQVMVLPLSAMLSEEALESPETAITLYTKDNQLISRKAFLHEQIRKDQDITYFKIEIANTDIHKVSEHLNQEMVGIPYIEIPETKKSRPTARGSRYEVNL